MLNEHEIHGRAAPKILANKIVVLRQGLTVQVPVVLLVTTQCRMATKIRCICNHVQNKRKLHLLQKTGSGRDFLEDMKLDGGGAKIAMSFLTP